MHFHCEIILPPTDDPEGAVKQIMEPFYEGGEENYKAFWDWYVIGGRWSGSKARARLDPERVEAFVDELKARKVTVSGVTAGKQSLSPASQVPEVDALWREWFPESGLEACPIFEHAGDRLLDDICRLGDTPLGMKVERVIVAGPQWGDATGLRAAWMAEVSCWNGVNHIATVWDGSIRAALELYREQSRQGADVTDDWLTVTVDYHT